MSYRDVRNFSEIVRSLGYSRTVSLESFRTPNFPLVADLLQWLTKRFDPEVEIASGIDTEEERVEFVRNIAQFFAIKVNIKLNTKKLYQSDGHAVKELLKIASLLHDALKTNSKDEIGDGDNQDEFNIRDFDISDKLHDLKQSRQLASEITTTGANLFDLLGKENELRQLRNSSIARQYEVQVVETNLKNAIEEIKQTIAETKQSTENITQTEAQLDAKIERRKVEIDRYEKRLQTLKKVRPAFLEEFSTLEHELETLFVQYSVKVRCLQHLEKVASDVERQQRERQQQQQSLLSQNNNHSHSNSAGVGNSNNNAAATAGGGGLLLSLPGDDEGLPEEEEEEEEVEVSGMLGEEEKGLPTPIIAGLTMGKGKERGVMSRQERPRARTGGRVKNPNKIYGTMHPPATTTIGGGLNSPPNNNGSSLELSSDSDSELFLDRDEQELINSEDDSIAFELSAMDLKQQQQRAPSGRKTSSKLLQHSNSDDDF